MTVLDLAQANLLSPLILCFVLGAVATLVHSDLDFPEPVFAALSIFLMLAVGLRGGSELSVMAFGNVIGPICAALGIGIAIPFWSFPILRRIGGFAVADAAAIAAHYGSVSAVTFVAVLSYLDAVHTPYEGFVPAMLALMEVPAIIVALALARGAQRTGSRAALAEIFTGKSVILLTGGLLIGWLGGPAGYATVKPFFGDLFRGALCLFLLELGMLAAARLRDFRKVGAFLAAFAIIMPILHALLGLLVGRAVGLSAGGATVLATLAASASYIAAPAAVRLALPDANPSLYLTASLAITFPFNLVFGIPLYRAMSQLLF